MGVMRRRVVEMRQRRAEHRVLGEAAADDAEQIHAVRLDHAKGQMQRRLARRQGVVILALRDVEQVARREFEFLGDGTLLLVVELFRQRGEGELGAGDRLFEPAFVEVPMLAPGDVQHEDVGVVEMRLEALLLLPGTIDVALQRAAVDHLQHTGYMRQFRR